MKGNIHLSVASVLAIVLTLSSNARALDSWQTPFDTADTNSESVDSILSLDHVLLLVAAESPVLRSLSFQLQAAGGNLEQAGFWPNPELDVELEEIGWDAPGFRESEFSISLSQEFEFFGQRRARRNVARAGIDATALQIKLSAFDLYLETKQRFYALAHAQRKVHLCQASVELAQEIVENAKHRLDRGASLQSELLLAQLEEQRALLALDQAEQDANALEVTLVTLWRGSPSGIIVSSTAEPDLTELLDKLSLLTSRADSTRAVLQLRSESKTLRAQRMLAAAEARPTITLSGGFKRFEVNGAKSFLFGVSLPVPFLNRNQGAQESINAQLRSLDYKIDRAEYEARASIQSHTMRLKQLVDRHATLDSVLLPTAKRACKTLKRIYEAGRLPYTQLLEAERALNELSSEHNDLLLAIREQIIAIEGTTGVALRADKED